MFAVCQWYCCGIPVFHVVLFGHSHFYGMSVVFLWYVCGMPVVHRWYFCGIPELCLWYVFGIVLCLWSYLLYVRGMSVVYPLYVWVCVYHIMSLYFIVCLCVLSFVILCSRASSFVFVFHCVHYVSLCVCTCHCVCILKCVCA